MVIGLDVGSTTIKCVVLDDSNQILYQTYERHFSQITAKTVEMLGKIKDMFPQEHSWRLAIAGSAGMGMAEYADVQFVQEVYAAKVAADHNAPGTDCIIELGGEDAKIIFLGGGMEARMNGTCAGGTGAFIDQMATLLDVETADMNALADAAQNGRLPGPMERAAIGQKLGEVLSAYTLLTDPDYTKDSQVYLFEEAALRGWAVEIPKYAETDEADTPISAIRTTRADICGLTIGKTTKDELIERLGEPKETRSYDADSAADRMLEAGESLFFELSGRILQAHVNENGVLSCLILRDAMPEDLY